MRYPMGLAMFPWPRHQAILGAFQLIGPTFQGCKPVALPHVECRL